MIERASRRAIVAVAIAGIMMLPAYETAAAEHWKSKNSVASGGAVEFWLDVSVSGDGGIQGRYGVFVCMLGSGICSRFGCTYSCFFKEGSRTRPVSGRLDPARQNGAILLDGFCDNKRLPFALEREDRFKKIRFVLDTERCGIGGTPHRSTVYYE